MSGGRYLPWLPSFSRRKGRGISQDKQLLMQSLYPKLEITLGEQGNLKEILSQSKPLWLEIGFGGGEHLADQAVNNPDILCLGAEPYYDGVASLMEHCDARAIGNVRVYMDDVRLMVKEMPDACIDRMFILYPDPWPKKKHNARRIVSLSNLEMFARVLKPGGKLHLATDHYDYAQWMLEHTLAHGGFEWQAESLHDWMEPPVDWVTTRYETKTRAEGRAPVYYHFIRK